MRQPDNESLQARIHDLEEALGSLADTWMDQQAAYPFTDQGQYAAAAVRVCVKELRAVLAPLSQEKSE